MAYHQLKQPMRALSELARAVADQPESPRAYNQLAVVLQSISWLNGAEFALKEAIKLDPDFPDAHFNLTLIYLDRDKPELDLARTHYREAMALGAKRNSKIEERLGL